ncbi:unnamed protein product [Amoebophrya sp. A25]|nr:unnamed protein product [Amoebophrya sp. A25]|eukprot:GSA25T00020752001.1
MPSARQGAAPSRTSSPCNSLVPPVVAKPHTDLTANSRAFVRDVIEILYEKVFINGEDALKLKREELDQQQALEKKESGELDESTGPTGAHGEDKNDLVASLLGTTTTTSCSSTDSIFNTTSSTTSKDHTKNKNFDRTSYIKRLRSRATQQLYVDWIRHVLDSRYGGGWHVLFGRDMGFAIRYRKGSAGFFGIGKEVRVLVYKSSPKSMALHNNRLLIMKPPEVKEKQQPLDDSKIMLKENNNNKDNIKSSTTKINHVGQASSRTTTSSSSTSNKLRVVDWYGYCAEEWKQQSTKTSTGARSADNGKKSNSKTASTTSEKEEAEENDSVDVDQMKKKKSSKQIIDYARSRDRFEPAIRALTEAVAFHNDDPAVYARSLRYHLSKELVIDQLDEEKQDGAAGGKEKATPVEAAHIKENEDHELKPSLPSASLSWHVFCGTDFVSSTAITVDNQITALYRKRRIQIFQHNSPDDPTRFTPMWIARQVFSDRQLLLKVIPYLVLFLLGAWYFGRRLLCRPIDTTSGGHAVFEVGASQTQAQLSTGATRTGDATFETSDSSYPPASLLQIHPDVNAWVGDDGAAFLASAFCSVDTASSSFLNYAAGAFIAVMTIRTINSKMGNSKR